MIQSLDEDSVQLVTILSNTGEQFSIERAVAKYSEVLGAALQSGDDNVQVKVAAETLKHCIEWMTLLHGGHKPRIDKPLTSIRGIEGSADEITIRFLCRVAHCSDETSTKDSKNKAAMYDLINAANYLMIGSLFEACCAFIASMVKAAPRGQVAQILQP
jgi:hypothetical protein